MRTLRTYSQQFAFTVYNCVLAKSLQSCQTLDSMDVSQLGSSVHGILQARILE